jgi:hypothetical protein
LLLVRLRATLSADLYWLSAIGNQMWDHTFSIGGPNGCTNANKDLYISDCGNRLEAARGPLKFQINTKIINYAIATYIHDLSYSLSLICLSLDM